MDYHRECFWLFSLLFVSFSPLVLLLLSFSYWHLSSTLYEGTPRQPQPPPQLNPLLDDFNSLCNSSTSCQYPSNYGNFIVSCVVIFKFCSRDNWISWSHLTRCDDTCRDNICRHRRLVIDHLIHWHVALITHVINGKRSNQSLPCHLSTCGLPVDTV